MRLIDGKFYVLSASSGKLINDNSKYLLLNYRNNPKFVYLVKDKSLLKFKKEYNLNIEYFYTLKSFYFLTFAKKFFLSHGTYDLSPIFMNGVSVIQLWHGIPLKKVVNDIHRNESIFKNILFYFYPQLNYSYCDQLLVGGDKCMLSHAFQKPLDHCQKIGFPRYLAFDKTFSDANSDILYNQELKNLEKYKKDGKKLIVYAPTYRQYDDTQEIVATLKALQSLENSIIIYKGHVVGSQLNAEENSKNKIYIYKEPDPYPLMNLCDLLITDYSSLFIDYSVTGKPFILYMHDYEKYQKTVGLYYDLKDDFNELSCFNQEGLIKLANYFLFNNVNKQPFIQVKNDFILKDNSLLFNIKEFEQKLL
ncbi:MAG: CDP-glycerol glycerophosphotransferase family protein [Silvanigrellaceae bacterium]|nr:CDP-glycerol glycerophosphotransferase family protein [Silvanigrellaceae bacterium]